jgi:hypothetical protein
MTPPLFVVARFMRTTDLDPQCRLVLYALAGRANAAGECWPSIDTLMTDTGLARLTIVRRVRSLVDAGLITTTRASRRKSMRYRITVPSSSSGELLSSSSGAPLEAPEDVRVVHPVNHSVVHRRTPSSSPGELEVSKKDPKKGSTLRASAEAPARKAPPARAKTSKPEGEKHRAVVACYVEAFKSARGIDPVIGGAEGTAVKRLLEKVGGDVDKAKAIIAAAYAPGRFGRDTATILTIAKDPSRCIGTTTTTRAAPKGPPQRARREWKSIQLDELDEAAS